MSNTVEQKLFNEIDKICKSTDLLQTLPLGEKVKLLEFRTHLCDLNGATKDALNIVVKAEDSDDKIRTYFIEINGALAKTVAQSSTETYGNAAAFGITSAILAENWDNPFAWFMAVVTAGAYHAFGKVTAIPLGDKAEKEAKIVAANLYDSYIDLVKNDKDGNLTIQTDKSEIDTFTKENMENILIKLPSDANLTIVHSGGNYAIDINASKKEININSSINLNEKNKESENFAGAILSSGAEVATINSQTYNIKELSNLELRNAIENIPQVSFLLSHILIKVGEYLDLGEKGIYKVKSGDTLSTIAQRNGMVTKDLVRLNPWLCDEGRISFNQNKVLIEGNPLNLSNTNHTLYGEANAENLLIDANGGDNEFIGGSKADKMESRGKGYDIYHANDGDEITDNDGAGEVWFNAKQLINATKDNNKNDKYFYDNNGGYFEIINKGLRYTSANWESIKFINLNLLVA